MISKMNILDHPAPNSSRHDCVPFAGSIQGAEAPFAGPAFHHSRCHISRGAGPTAALAASRLRLTVGVFLVTPPPKKII